MSECNKCDTFGGKVTFENQVCMPIEGKVQSIDFCIHQIVAALNAANIGTIASCCGHGLMDGRIDLFDGRILTITNPTGYLKEKGECVNNGTARTAGLQTT